MSFCLGASILEGAWRCLGSCQLPCNPCLPDTQSSSCWRLRLTRHQSRSWQDQHQSLPTGCREDSCPRRIHRTSRPSLRSACRRTVGTVTRHSLKTRSQSTFDTLNRPQRSTCRQSRRLNRRWSLRNCPVRNAPPHTTDSQKAQRGRMRHCSAPLDTVHIAREKSTPSLNCSALLGILYILLPPLHSHWRPRTSPVYTIQACTMLFQFPLDIGLAHSFCMPTTMWHQPIHLLFQADTAGTKSR